METNNTDRSNARKAASILTLVLIPLLMWSIWCIDEYDYMWKLAVDDGYSMSSTIFSTAASHRKAVVGGHLPEACTMAACFDFDRCRNGLTFYLYPGNATFPLAAGAGAAAATDMKRGAVALMERVIRDRFKVVTNPEEACLFINPYQTSNEGDALNPDPKDLSLALAALPHWNNGRNHLITFYNSDLSGPNFVVGDAIVLSGSFIKATYRPGYDLMLPLIHWDNNMENLRLSTRDILLFFEGTVYGWRHCGARGRTIKALGSSIQDQDDVLFFGRCRGTWDGADRFVNFSSPEYPESCRSCVTGGQYCNYGMNWTEPWVEYADGLHRAKFSFAPSGCGPLSFRLIETIFTGGVPVQAGDDAVLPYEGDDTDISRAWKTCILFPTEAALPYLVSELRNMSTYEYHERLHACNALVKAQQNDLYHVFWLGLCNLGSRIRQSLLSLDLREECDQIVNHFRAF